MLALSVVLVCLCTLVVRCAPAEVGELAPFAAARAYDVEGTLLLNEAEARDREVGYKIRAALSVAPVWSAAPAAPHSRLLSFHLSKPKLYLRGKHRNAEFLPHDSILDSYADSTFYAHWNSGRIESAYLDPNELTDLQNFKKSLLSAFQFQIIDGEYNETDISGECEVLYETVSEQTFRKIKRRCGADAAPGARFRRVARYELHARALAALHSEEVLQLPGDRLGLKARSWLTLRVQAAPPPPRPALAAPSLSAALAALPAHLQPTALAPAPSDPADDQDHQYRSLEEALAENSAALEGEAAGAEGGADAALALLRLLPAVRAASQAQLHALLLDPARHHQLAGLCRAAGLAGRAAGVRAAVDALQLRSADPLLPLADTFLQAFALADAPQEEAVLDVLRLGEESRVPALAHSALLAAAAAARAADPAPPAPPATPAHTDTPAPPTLSLIVRDALAKSLARCKDDECRRVRLQALGNLRRADTAELLLQHAERAHAAPAARAAALDALLQAPPAALSHARLERLLDLALDPAAPLELRAAALDLVAVRRARLPAPLARAAHALHAGPHELRRAFWQRLHALAAEHAAVRDVIPMLDPRVRTWDAQAHGGTSSVLVRDAGWAAGGWRAALQSVQVARAGLLRRGSVRLHALHDQQPDPLHLLSVDVWTRGLEAIAGGADGADSGAEAEDTAGGLALSVGGTRMRDISLFSGQAELVGHVWAGTASAPTPALRALLSAPPVAARAPLLLGATLHYGWRGALALALDAHAQVSLWWRTARCQLDLRAGGVALHEARLHTAWGRLEANATVVTEPRLRIAADLDFYDKIALCVRASAEPHALRRNVTLHSRQGARRLRVTRRSARDTVRPPRTLALGALNDRACRHLRAADSDADADADAQ